MKLTSNISFLLRRHLPIALLSFLLALPFWYGRMDWDPEMRLWRAIGDSSFLLLFFTLAIGPIARLWPAAASLVSWRRETGIWYGLTAFLHAFLIFDGWARWEWQRFFGYEFVPELNRVVRLEPGFGLANLIGLVAVFLTLLLAATSANWAVNRLGASAWKWLHYSSYTVFYLVVLHTIYFLFIHYTASFHRRVPEDSNWFQIPFLVLAAIIPLLQGVAFLKAVARRRTPQSPVSNSQ